jgi:hypothetical protein
MQRLLSIVSRAETQAAFDPNGPGKPSYFCCSSSLGNGLSPVLSEGFAEISELGAFL